MRVVHVLLFSLCVASSIFALPLVVAWLLFVPLGQNALIQNWGWALIPLLIVASVTGLIALYLRSRVSSADRPS